MRKLLCYTRKPINEKLYDPRLAYSMHLALMTEGEYKALNHNSGVLFALATENEDGSLNPKCIKHPYIFNLKNGSFAVIAVRTDGEGGNDEESMGNAILFVSSDLVEYKECGLISLDNEYIDKAVCSFCEEEDVYRITFKNESGQCKTAKVKDIMAYIESEAGLQSCPATDDEVKLLCSADINVSENNIPGIIAENEIDIEDGVAKRLWDKFTVPMHIATEFPVSAIASTAEELTDIRAKAIYSDGTSAVKRVDWDLSNVDWNIQTEYAIEGRLHQDHFEFPIAENRADPCMMRWQGKYYFISTNDADHEHSIYVRVSDTVPGLVTAKDNLILDTNMYDYAKGLLWAPEFHEVNGKLYIFIALTSGEFFYEESHVMELREGGDPVCKEDWSAPKRVVKADGSDICEAGKTITLDMTCFMWEGDYYAIWSQRQFLPKDLGAWLYIAKLNADEPWKLASEPVVLSKPDYGWANNHTFVDEGPFAIIKEDRLILTFSSAAVDTSYVVGLLSIDKGKDLLVRENWKKANAPILTSRSVEGEFGTGHNAYLIDEYGDIWNTYHARPGVDGARSSGVRRLHFDIDGLPRLDLVEENDVNQSISKVKTTLIVS